jgi:hypothetical protein
MVAIPRLDFVGASVWVGGLAIVLVGRAVFSWLAFRRAYRLAQRGGGLEEAIRLGPAPRPPVRPVLPVTGRTVPQQSFPVDETPARPRSTVKV